MAISADSAVVYVVDDDPTVCSSLERLLKAHGFRGQSFCSAEEFISRCPEDARGCLVLDVRMPGTTGLELQNLLASHRIHLPIIFITGHGDIPMTVRAMKAGAVDFLPKPFKESQLLAAVRQGIARDENDRQQRAEFNAARDRIETLTPREKQVLAMVAGGMLGKRIARRLDITERTVKAHRQSIMEKTQAKSVAELVSLAERAGVAVVSG